MENFLCVSNRNHVFDVKSLLATFCHCSFRSNSSIYVQETPLTWMEKQYCGTLTDFFFLLSVYVIICITVPGDRQNSEASRTVYRYESVFITNEDGYRWDARGGGVVKGREARKGVWD